MFYYPLFQIEFPVVCEPGVPLNEPGFTDNIQIILPGWNYSEQLTNSWIENNSNFSPVYPIRCNWMIYEKINPLEADQPSNRNIRVYVKPIVPISIWSLYKEDNI